MHDWDDAAGDRELRSLLEKIAATAGDPPEHGLARIAIMRRRRKRHRRGAVAAAMALTVATIGGGAWLTGQRDSEHDVAVAAQTDGRPSTAELPDVLEVRCSPEGIEVPVASIRPQPDGLHISVVNGAGRNVELRVMSEANGWDSGPVVVRPGESMVRQPVPPGVLTVACSDGEVEERRRVDLVDEDQLYTVPELSCPDVARRVDPTDELGIDPPERSAVMAVRMALDGIMEDADRVLPLDGYPDQELGDPTVEPVVRVVREGSTVAFVTLLTAEDEESVAHEGPWSSARLMEACEDFLESEPDGEVVDPDAPGDAPGASNGSGNGA